MSDKNTLVVTQKKSPIGRQSDQKKTLIGLGLNKIGRSKVLNDTPSNVILSICILFSVIWLYDTCIALS